MSNAKRHFARFNDGLRCYTTRPENWQLARLKLRFGRGRIHIVCASQILDTDSCWVTQVYRRAMHLWETGADLDGSYGLRRLHGAHGHDHRPVKALGRYAFD